MGYWKFVIRKTAGELLVIYFYIALAAILGARGPFKHEPFVVIALGVGYVALVLTALLVVSDGRSKETREEYERIQRQPS